MTKLINSVLGTVLAAAVQLLLGTRQALAIYIRDDVGVAQYNNLAAQPQYQAVGYLGFTGAAFSFCAGTLICQLRRENASACRRKTASRMMPNAPTGERLLRGNQDEKRITS